MPAVKVIPVSRLLVNPDNPRIADTLEGQSDAIGAIASSQKKKLVSLAKDMLRYGANPAEQLMVTPAPETNGYFLVLEGNRRLAALKILADPETFSDLLDDGVLRAFRDMHRNHAIDPISALSCVVFENELEARHWIELKHTGQNDGAGVVPWGAAESERYQRRTGAAPAHEQVLDFLEKGGYITREQRKKTPVTSLKRLLGTPHVRNKLGIVVRNGKVSAGFDMERVAKALTQVVDDLASGRIRTGDIYHSNDRKAYVDSLPSETLPQPGREQPELFALDGADREAPTHPSTPRSRPSASTRKTVIPSRGFSLVIKQDRINEIYHELRRLNFEHFVNASAVLFRVFLELSLDEYIKRHGIDAGPDSRLCHKLNVAANHLGDQGILDQQELKPVRRAAQDDSFLGASVTTLHQYVHNQHFHPAPGDLVAFWDSLQPFIVALWK